MEYRFEKERGNYADFASGRVLLNAPGTTAFPVRLASELYLRAREVARKRGAPERLTVYDPCCGGAYWLATIGLLHGSGIRRLIGSDSDPRAVALANRNLAMVNVRGLAERAAQLEDLYRQFGKTSHAEALESARRLTELAERRGFDIETECVQADATETLSREARFGVVDLVVADVPYGAVTGWSSQAERPIEAMLEALFPLLAPHAAAVVVADKKQTVRNSRYRRVERLVIGKRQACILVPDG